MTSQNRTYYEILGVPEDASFEEIRAAFRERAREYHPDRNPSPDAVERMQEINEAYEVLRDEGQRAAYDRAHRTLGASVEELARAKAIAAMVLGGMAFNLGIAIATRISNHWTERIRRLEDIPTGVWHAAYEIALESALTGRSESEILQATLDAAWHAVQSESARLMYRHALAERSRTFTERFAVDIEVNILGSTAAVIGFALGRQNIQESLPASVWSQADEAIRRSVTRSIQLRGGVATPQMLRDNTFINSVFDDAAQEANRVLRPHTESIGRRVGRSPHRGGRVASSGSTGDGCVTILGRVFGIALVGLMILGIVLYLGSLGPTPTPTAQPTIAATSTPFATRVPTPFPGIGECLDPILLNRTSCSTQGSLLIVGKHNFPTVATYPSDTRFASVARSQCPTTATTYVYPSQRSWGAGDRTMWCVR